MNPQHAANARLSGTSADALLFGLQRDAIRYFLDNQLPNGLVLDRQRNHGRRKFTGLCSISATGMGLIAICLASSAELSLITEAAARKRIKKALRTALNKLPHVKGMLPHFVDARTLTPVGSDAISTVDSAWLFAGALWAAEYFCGDTELKQLADELYARVDWLSWSNGGTKPLLHHGADVAGNKLKSVWDRYNAETAFMYVLAFGAQKKRSLPPQSMEALDPAFGKLAGETFINADLGLFVFQYSLELLDVCKLPSVNGVDLLDECIKATRANHAFCWEHREQYQTFRHFWGISAGDGPCDLPCVDAYRAYSPTDSMDGTVHITATLASIGHSPHLVMPNVKAAESAQWKHIRGRYGYSNVNVDRDFVSRDIVGIDLGAAVLALDNVLHAERVRDVFMRLRPVRLALRRIRSAAEKA